MNLKKFALCVISMIMTVMLFDAEAAYAEEAFNTEEVVSNDAVTEQVEVPVSTLAAEQIAIPVSVSASEVTVVPEVSLEQEVIQEETKPAEKVRKNAKKIKAGGAGDNNDYSKADLRLMSAIIYCEANMEPYAGKLGVGIVVMNRVKSSSFPSTIKGVIYQRGQFSPVRNDSLKRALARYDAGKFTSDREKQCIKAAKAALNGEKTVRYKGKTKNMGNYKYFSGYLSRAKYRISGHMFK